MVIATLVFVVMFIADFTSTVINGELVQHLESNPLYSHLGLGGLAVLNIGVAAAFYYGYRYSTRANIRHSFLFTLILVSLLRIFIVYNNIQAYLHPLPLEVARSIPQAVKTTAYIQMVVSPILLCWGVGMLSFWLYNKDHNIQITE